MTDEVMLETTMRDWRCAEGMEDAVRPEHRGEFKVKISRTGYGGLMIDLETPQGEAHSVLIEADEGVVKLLTFTADTEERGADRTKRATRLRGRRQQSNTKARAGGNAKDGRGVRKASARSFCPGRTSTGTRQGSVRRARGPTRSQKHNTRHGTGSARRQGVCTRATYTRCWGLS